MRKTLLYVIMSLVILSLVNAGILDNYYKCSDNQDDYGDDLMYFDDFNDTDGTLLNNKSLDYGNSNWNIESEFIGKVYGGYAFFRMDDDDAKLVLQVSQTMNDTFSLYFCRADEIDTFDTYTMLSSPNQNDQFWLKHETTDKSLYAYNSTAYKVGTAATNVTYCVRALFDPMNDIYSLYINNTLVQYNTRDIQSDQAAYLNFTFGCGRGSYCYLDYILMYNGTDPCNVYYKYNDRYTRLHQTPKVETDSTTFVFTINFTGIEYNYNFSSITADLVYNKTAYSMLKNIKGYLLNFSRYFTFPFGNGTYEFYYNFTVNGTSYQTDLENMTIDKMAIVKCSASYTQEALNASFQNIQNSSSISPDLDSYFKIWKSDESLYRIYTFNETGHSSYQWCISPPYAALSSNFNLIYSLSEYTTNSYNKIYYGLSNVTKYLSLYMLPTTGGTTISIYVVDEFGDGINNQFVEANEYNLANNTFKSAGIMITDINGEAEFSLDTTKKHQFIVRNEDGTVIYTSPNMNLYSTEYTFSILPTTSIVIQDMMSSITRTLKISDASPFQINYTWNDISNTSNRICLRITNTSIINDTKMYDNCSLASASTLRYIFSATDGLFTVYGYGFSKIDGIEYPLDTDVISLRTAYDVYDTEGMLYAGIFVGTMAFLGLGAAAVSTMGGIIMVILMLFSSVAMMMLGLMNIKVGGIIFLSIMSIIVILVISREQ